jgi:uncharacterized membrane protein YoaK (UPF0700 family)
MGPGGGAGTRRRGGDGGAGHRAALLWLLALTAGCADGIGFLLLGAFTANQTGNIVLLGLAAGGGDMSGAAAPGLALAGFVVGVAVGTLIAGGPDRGGDGRVGARHRLWPPRTSVALGLELVLLLGIAAGLLAVGSTPAAGARSALIALAAIAMGTQSAAARSLGVPGVWTTVVTGNITTLVGGVVDRTGGTGARALHGGVVIAYLAGAIAAGAGLQAWARGTAFLPAALIVAVLVVATRRRSPAGDDLDGKAP